LKDPEKCVTMGGGVYPNIKYGGIQMAVGRTFCGTKWSDGSNPQSTVSFTHNQATLAGPYWDKFGNIGVYQATSNTESVIVHMPNGNLELIKYNDGRLTVQEEAPRFFSKI